MQRPTGEEGVTGVLKPQIMIVVGDSKGGELGRAGRSVGHMI
jgi:hypothetical protein